MNRTNTVSHGTVRHFSTYGLALFLFLTPFEYPLADLMATSPLRLVGLLAMGLAVLDILLQKRIKLDYRFLLVALWLAYGLVSYVWAIDTARFQSYYSIYFNNALMFLLFSLVAFNGHEVKILKNALILGVGALLLYMAFVPGAVSYTGYQNRLTLNAGEGSLDQNYLAALLLISFGLVFHSVCNSAVKKRYLLISVVYCAAIAYCILLTGSRSGLIALLLIALLSLNTSWKTRLTVGIPIVLILIVVVPLVLENLSPDLLERFTLSAITGQEGESETRLIIWKKAITSFEDLGWVLGHGFGSSQTVVGNALENGKDMAIHNHFIAMLVEGGIIGFFLINIPIFKMIAQLWRKNRAASVSFCGIIVISMFIDILTTKFFWSSLIFLSAVFSSCKQNPSANEKEVL